MRSFFYLIRKAGMLFVLFLTAIVTVPVFSAPDYTTMGRAIKDNRSHIIFLDLCLINLDIPPEGTEEYPGKNDLINRYEKVIEDDLKANMLYLTGDYGASFRMLSKSRSGMEYIYRKILEQYLAETRFFLEFLSPGIIRSQDPVSRDYLTLSYRDLEKGKLLHLRGYNSEPQFPANKVEYYRDGLKIVRRSRRYALRSFAETALTATEKQEMSFYDFDDLKNADEKKKAELSAYEKTQSLLVNLIAKKSLPAKVSADYFNRKSEIIIMNVLDDSFNRMIRERVSIYDEIVKKLSNPVKDPVKEEHKEPQPVKGNP